MLYILIGIVVCYILVRPFADECANDTQRYKEEHPWLS
jgi:hypothetical protein